jgi:Flp pilus assembly pilin Flp
MSRLWCRIQVRAHGDRGASAVEYGLLAAAVTTAFLVGTAGFNGVLGEVFQKALDGLGATVP